MKDVEMVGDLLLQVLLALVSSGLCWAGWRQLVKQRKRSRLYPFEVLSPFELQTLRKSLGEPEERRVFDDLVVDLQTSGDGAVRRLHIPWISDVIAGEMPMRPVFRVPVPTGPANYSMLTDAGIALFSGALKAQGDGDSVTAEALLRKGAMAGSPLCMVTYGTWLLRGDVQGLDGGGLDGVAWLEKAAQVSEKAVGVQQLGHLYVEGVLVEQDAPRGLRLLEESLRVEVGAGKVDAMNAMGLAGVYLRGAPGVPVDERRAVACALSAAPLWRRAAARLGWNPLPWVRREAAALEEIRRGFDGTTTLDRQRGLRKVMEYYGRS